MVGVTVRASEVFLRYFHCLKSALQYQSFILILILINNDPCEAETEFWLWSDDKWWMLGLEERSRCCCTGHSKAGAWKVGNKRIVEVCTIDYTPTPGQLLRGIYGKRISRESDLADTAPPIIYLTSIIVLGDDDTQYFSFQFLLVNITERPGFHFQLFTYP